MTRNNIRLFIDDMEVDGIKDIDILFNKEITDYSNPTVVQNSYTKSISIPGTKNNNALFGHFFRLDRIQLYNGNTGPSYNPSYRIPFTLYINGDIYESGYMKLEQVTRHGHDVTYQVCLYGGLGQFLYNLDMDWTTGQKKKLSDLFYMYHQDDIIPADEFNFRITKEFIDDCWQHGFEGTPSPYINDYINFAPCYNGIPQNISADKVLVNMSGNTVFQSTSGTYESYHNYALGELGESVTEWECHDLRSYNQRPILSMKGFIEAISQPVNNKGEFDTGYTVDLSDPFFEGTGGNEGRNPYYEDAWITLPKLSNIEFKSEGGQPQEWTPEFGTTLSVNGADNRAYILSNSMPAVSTNSVHVEFEFITRVTIENGHANPSKLYCSTKWLSSGNIDLGAWAIQLVCGNSDTVSYGTGDVLGGSDIIELTSNYNGKTLDIQDLMRNGFYQPAYAANVQESDGYFVFDHEAPGPYPDSTYHYGYYKWFLPVTLDAEIPAGTVRLAIRINRIGNISYITTGSGKNQKTSPTMGSRPGKLYSSKDIATQESRINYFGCTEDRSFSFNGISGIWYRGINGIYSGARITKQKLLNTEYSPADLLLSYCKMFGLYLEKDKFKNKIYIRSRNTFYNRDDIKNIEDLVDYEHDVTITPLVADAAYYNMTTPATDDGITMIDSYAADYGKSYGMKTFKTGYNFDATAKELYESSCLKGTVDVLEKGRYYFKDEDDHVPVYIYGGVDYKLYKNGDASSDNTLDMRISRKNFNQFDYFNENYPEYDLFVKPQFHDVENKELAGDAVLLLYNQKVSVPPGVTYNLTDDVAEMAVLNDGKPCWLYTESEYGYGGEQVAIRYNYDNYSRIPLLQRYRAEWNLNASGYGIDEAFHSGFLTHSMDFGDPRKLYVPYYVNKPVAHICNAYWDSYLIDLYDVNTKRLNVTCRLKETIDDSWFRRFYWFENTIWRLNRICDYNVVKPDEVNLEFIKVENIDAYSNRNVRTDPVVDISITDENGKEFSKYEDYYIIPSTGCMAYVTVTVSDGSRWSAEQSGGYDYVEFPEEGYGDTTFEVEFLEYDGDDNYPFFYTIFAGTDSDAQLALIYTVNDNISISPTIKTVNAAGNTFPAIVTSNSEWDIVSNPSWVTLSTTHGQTGSTGLYITVDSNASFAPRIGFIELTTIGAEPDSTRMTITQSGLEPEITVQPSEITFNATGGTQIITIDSNVNWIIE